MKSSIVIPCGRPECLAALFQALSQQSAGRETFEVVVVVPRRPAPLPPSAGIDVAWVETGELLPPGAMRNRGACRAHGEVLCFLDDDCVPPADWLAEMTETLACRLDVAAVGCRVTSFHRDFWNGCADYVLFSAMQLQRSEDRPLASAALAVRSVAFQQAKGFDENLRASEDWDFSLRLRKMGWKTHFHASVVVAHDHGRGGLWRILKQSYLSGVRSGLAVQKLHPTECGRAGRLACRLGRCPWSYPLFAFAYIPLLCVLQVWELRGTDSRWFLYLPLLVAGRTAYQIGVWRNIMVSRTVPP